MNNSSYFQWRKNIKLQNAFYLDNSCIEYTQIDNEQIPYLITEITQCGCELDQNSWHKSILGFKKHQAEFMRKLSKELKLQWLIVLFKNDYNKNPQFKIYNDKRIHETIYSEHEYLNILEEYKNDAIKQYNCKKSKFKSSYSY